MRNSVQIGRMWNEMRAIQDAFSEMHQLYNVAKNRDRNWFLYLSVLEVKLTNALQYRIDGPA
jgi:hypothetical protein